MLKMLNDIDWDFASQGFVTGFSMYSALPILRALMQRKRVNSASWKTAAAAGAFFGGYRLTIQLLEKLGFPPRYRRALAGSIASAGGLIVDDSFVSSILVLWWAVRAARTVLPHMTRPVDGSVAAMCAATSMLAPSAFMFKDEHARSYQRFMEQMSLGTDRHSLLHPLNLRRGSSIHYPREQLQTLCDAIPWHRGHSSCTRAVLMGTLPRQFLLALKLYTPLYVAWAMAKGNLKVSQLLSNVARSSSFLALYSSSIYLTTMWYQSTINPSMSRAAMMATSSVAGLWVLLERKSRRAELATYCMSHALNAAFSVARKRGHFKGSQRMLGCALLVASTALLAHHHKQHSPMVQKLFGMDHPAHDREAKPV